MIIKIDVSPDILIWAITRAGYVLENFLESFPDIKKWLTKDKKPTILELERLSDYLNIPFGYLLLSTPQKETIPIPFYKTYGNGQPATDISLNIYNIVLLMQGRQEWLSHYLRDNGSKPYSYVGKFHVNSSPNNVADHMRDTFELSAYWPRGFATWNQAFNFLIRRAEELGIVVAFSSSVKQDNFRPIELNECRGIALAAPFAPYLYINVADIRAAQMFTLAYGLAHIWIGKTAGFDFMQLCPAQTPSEQLCYKIAAEFLAPAIIFHHAWEQRRDVDKMVKLFRLSPIVIVKRGVDLGKFSEFDFFNFYEHYTTRIVAKNKDWMSSQGGSHVNKRWRMGRLLFKYIKEAVKANRLLYYDAYRLSKVKGKVCVDMLKE